MDMTGRADGRFHDGNARYRRWVVDSGRGGQSVRKSSRGGSERDGGGMGSAVDAGVRQSLPDSAGREYVTSQFAIYSRVGQLLSIMFMVVLAMVQPDFPTLHCRDEFNSPMWT